MKDRAETQSLVEAFLENGGQIQKLPYRAPTNQQSLKDAKKPSPQQRDFDPKEESRKLEELAAQRARELEEYRTKKIRGEIPSNATPPPWEG